MKFTRVLPCLLVLAIPSCSRPTPEETGAVFNIVDSGSGAAVSAEVSYNVIFPTGIPSSPVLPLPAGTPLDVQELISEDSLVIGILVAADGYEEAAVRRFNIARGEKQAFDIALSPVVHNDASRSEKPVTEPPQVELSQAERDRLARADSIARARADSIALARARADSIALAQARADSIALARARADSAARARARENTPPTTAPTASELVQADRAYREGDCQSALSIYSRMPRPEVVNDADGNRYGGIRLRVARCQRREKDFEKAITTYTEVLDSWGHQWHAKYELGMMYCNELTRYEQGMAVFADMGGTYMSRLDTSRRGIVRALSRYGTGYCRGLQVERGSTARTLGLRQAAIANLEEFIVSAEDLQARGGVPTEAEARSVFETALADARDRVRSLK